MKNQNPLDKARDTGLALVLLLLLLVYFGRLPFLVPVAAFLLALVMAWPALFRPVSVLWFGLSHVMGTCMSKILLGLLFFLVVQPIGLFRRATGADSMQLKKWKTGPESVLRKRELAVQAKDLEQPY
jgi:hypothetical protein